MYTIKTESAFDSAHFLYGYEGKCRNLHGHRWKIEVEVGCSTLHEKGQERGMLVDFSALKAAVRGLADRLDHALIYETGTLKENTLCALQEEGFALIAVPFRPTAENFSKYVYDEISGQGFQVVRTVVYETPNNCAYYVSPLEDMR